MTWANGFLRLWILLALLWCAATVAMLGKDEFRFACSRMNCRSMAQETSLLGFLGWPSNRRHWLNAVDYVITIENPTSFWRYSTEIDGNYLALSTDGFPARDVISSMAHLVRTAHLMAPNTPVYHWGDIDAGGLRIAAHLEDTFETAIRLHQMEHELALTLGSPLQSNKGLEKLASRPGQIGRLAGWLRSGGSRMLEQEELDPKTPIIAALLHDQS
jgi:hypothetical protein